ncbi:MAG: type II toxin-antitoxin system RelE/ParE family toxin [Candidatus Micrarchaeota archaeon]
MSYLENKPYVLKYNPSCSEEIVKATRKNKPLEEALRMKIAQILENPFRFKPLRPPLQNKFRVHILKSFVLIFEASLADRIVYLVKFGHHDEAYNG